MKLIVGIGNPETEYAGTRHNIGFQVIDEICKTIKVTMKFEKKLKADIYVTMRGGETIILAKPQTFVNLSGDSVAKIANFYKIQTADIWVISDDLALDFGTIRVRVGGSSGGHNGLKDIIGKVGPDFTRFRVGIKNSLLEKVPTEKFVLQKFNKEELTSLEGIYLKASELVLESLDNGIEHTSIK
ncbi:MAG: aminoacyl-tRNA hydrolase [Candidatus Saccharibacteria bacterium]